MADLVQKAIDASDWLGCHVYWQTPPGTRLEDENWQNPMWGLRFRDYHTAYPTKDIEITEYGNTNGQSQHPLEFTDRARQYVSWLELVRQEEYVKSVHAFISSSPHQVWHDQHFAWADINGESFDEHIVQGMAGVPHS